MNCEIFAITKSGCELATKSYGSSFLLPILLLFIPGHASRVLSTSGCLLLA